jgi:thiol-disulfide isomerase/thioredoxin
VVKRSIAAGARALACAVLLATVAAASGAVAQAENQVGLPAGTAPPDVELEDLDGNAVQLGDLVGSGPVLIEFWATWCPVCEQLAPEMDAAHERFGDRVRFVVIAVGVNQSQRSVRRHLEEHPMPYLFLWDGKGRAVRAYRAPTTSYIVILDAGGKVAYTGVGERQDLVGALERIVG